MKKKTVWKSPNSSNKSFKEKELLKILSDSGKTKEFLKRLNEVESTANKVKNNTDEFINVTQNNVDKFIKQFKFDSPYIWFTFIKRCLPDSLNTEEFKAKLQAFIIGYVFENNKELYQQFIEDNNNGEIQDK